MNRHTIIAAGLAVCALVGSASPSHATVDVNIGINLSAPPSFVTIPGAPVAYAPAAPGNVFFYENQYWVFANNTWYEGPTFRGPWVVVEPAYIPLPLLNVPVRFFRAPPVAWKGWHREAPPRWNPAWGREWHNAHRDYDHDQHWDGHAQREGGGHEHEGGHK